MNQGLIQLNERAPAALGPFEGTELGLPVTRALFGKEPELPALLEAARNLAGGEVKDAPGSGPGQALAVALALAEAIESAQGDRQDFFVSDLACRNQIVLTKRRLGWALVLGDGDPGGLAEGLARKGFMVFSTTSGIKGAWSLGPRETASIYFFQMIVRHALIYGRVEPGDVHELKHFLEDEGVGVIVAQGRLSPVESLLVLAQMGHGVPAVVPPAFPYPYGQRIVAEGVAEALEAAISFPHLRIRLQRLSRVELPPYLDPLHTTEKVEAPWRHGGTERSFFVVQRREGRIEDGTEVIGEAGEDLGVIVELDDPKAEEVTTAYYERQAAGYPRYLKGVGSVLEGDSLGLRYQEGAEIMPERIAEAIRLGLKYNFPRLDRVKVTLIFDQGLLEEKKKEVQQYKRERQEVLVRLDEDSVEEFYTCAGCSTFALEHLCVITPVRTPMCGREWVQIKVCSQLLQEDPVRDYARKSLELPHAIGAIPKGRCLDPLRGEYEGVNEAVRRATKGQVNRIFLHSLQDYPHTNCGCFENIAFYLEGVEGIGVMHRGFDGVSPEGRGWDSYANEISGRQYPGAAGVSMGYLLSREFLQGDGGHGKIVWMTRKLRDKLLAARPGLGPIATEEEVSDLRGLEAFLRGRR